MTYSLMKYGLFGALFMAVGGGVFAFGSNADAHHSFSATYEEEGEIEIEGEIVQFLFRNPHAWVHVMAPDENGDMQRWGVEWGGASLLIRQGVTRTTFKPGDHVIIRGNPGRNPVDHRIRMQSILRPSDGFGWGFEEGDTFD